MGNDKKNKKDKKNNPNDDLPADPGDFERLMRRFFKEFFSSGSGIPDDFIRNMEYKDFLPDIPGMKTDRYSISYRFGSDMDKPEIRVNGKHVDFKNFSDFFEKLGSKIPGGLNFDDKFSNFRSFRIQNGGSKPILSVDAEQLSLDQGDILYAEPIFEIYENGKEHHLTSAEVILEMPGVLKDDVIINYVEKGVTISGEVEHGKKIFQITINLKFKPKIEDTIINEKNGIYTITFKE
ncbi:MAG: Hsp20/alpha crystallin family protein [Promethearchaeota archaeon]